MANQGDSPKSCLSRPLQLVQAVSEGCGQGGEIIGLDSLKKLK